MSRGYSGPPLPLEIDGCWMVLLYVGKSERGWGSAPVDNPRTVLGVSHSEPTASMSNRATPSGGAIPRYMTLAPSAGVIGGGDYPPGAQ
jgi:hypothetical protein